MRLTVLGMAIAASTMVLLPACSRISGSDDVLPAVPAAKIEATDELATVPSRPLALPESVAALPPPSPSSVDRAQLDPLGDARSALGADQPSRSAGEVPRSDYPLVTYTSRLGMNPHIRLVLAKEDEEFRRGKKGRLLERWFRVNLYFQAYEPMTLNPDTALVRLRQSGIKTPAAPPPPEK